MKKQISFLTSGKAGDILAALPGIRNITDKATIYIRLGVISIVQKNSQMVEETELFNMDLFEMIKPLLMAQPYIESVEVYEGQHIDYNLDIIRQQKISIPYGSLARWYFYAFPEMACDLSVPFITCEDTDTALMVKDHLLINLTSRYRNNWINYEFLNERFLDTPIYFLGTAGEAHDFVDRVPRAKWLQVDDFLDMAVAIKNCKLFLGNQSLPYWIAEGLKVPRVLEVCPFAPNCIGEGGGFYDFHTQPALEFYLKNLL